MPSTITHAYMAKDIYHKLDKEIKNKFKNHLDEYITYYEGPDILFFYPVVPPFSKCIDIRKLGGRVHREKVNEFFISLVKSVKKDKDFDKFIFLAGLLTHYIGDTTCHPFVNYKAWVLEKETKKKKDYHFLVEAYIDNYILDTKGENYKKYKCYKLLKTKKNIKIKDMLDKSFLEVFNEKNMGNIYYKCLFNMKLLYYLIRYDPYKIKRIIYCVLHFFTPFLYRLIHYFSYNFNLSEKENIFYLNLEHDKWFNIRKKDVVYNKSFVDLYKETVDKSSDKIKKLYDYIYNNKELDLEIFFGNVSYANGLPISPNKK